MFAAQGEEKWVDLASLRSEFLGLVVSRGNLGRVLRGLVGTPVPAILVGILKRNYPVI